MKNAEDRIEPKKVAAPERSPLVVAVVLNWNAPEDTAKCVRSLRQVEYPSLEIVLVDNASTDGSPAKLREWFPAIPLMIQPTNGGYAAGNNAGIRFALERGAAYVLVLNNDVVVDKNFLIPMVGVAERYRDVGVVACRIFYQCDPGQLYYSGGRFSRVLCTGVNNPGTLFRRRQETSVREVNFINGSLLLVRREVLETVGLFNETFFMYFEDLEFSRRVSNRYRLAYVPSAVVYHKSGAGKGWSSYSEGYLYYHTRNRFWVFRNDPFYYRVYTSIFTVANALAKSAVLLTTFFQNGGESWEKLKALWRGIRDGLQGPGLP